MPTQICTRCSGTGGVPCYSCGGQGVVFQPLYNSMGPCPGCGGGRFLPCLTCRGQKTVFVSQEELDRQRAAAATAMRAKEQEAQRQIADAKAEADRKARIEARKKAGFDEFDGECVFPSRRSSRPRPGQLTKAQEHKRQQKIKMENRINSGACFMCGKKLGLFELQVDAEIKELGIQGLVHKGCMRNDGFRD